MRRKFFGIEKKEKAIYHWKESLLGDGIDSIYYSRDVTKERQYQANPELDLYQNFNIIRPKIHFNPTQRKNEIDSCMQRQLEHHLIFTMKKNNIYRYIKQKRNNEM